MIWATIKHFKPSEFDSPDAPGSGVLMNIAFVAKLDKLREMFGAPIIIRSGYRTAKHNAIVGGVDSSAHTGGHAADIAAVSSRTRFKLVDFAMTIGFRRIGIGTSFLHLDDSPDHDQDVIWLYQASRGK